MIKEYRVYYDGTLATKEQLDEIEEIVVEQEVGLKWTARMKIPICIAEDGSWDAEEDPAYAENARVRVEAKIGEGSWVPLIEGKIARQQRDLNAQPGLSSVVLMVEDDTALLHRAHVSDSFPPGFTDSKIARRIIADSELTGPPDVDEVEGTTDPNSIVNQHGSVMQMLRTLMSRNRDFYAYVLPGTAVGVSIGCFKKLPETPDPALPVMYLTGDGRNLGSFNISLMSDRAARFRGDSLNLDDMTVSNGDASYRDSAPSRGESATSLSDDQALDRRLPPGNGDHGGPQRAADGSAQESSFTLSAEGSVLPSCYPAILVPYKMVPVRLSNSRFSTDYVIFKVTHTLGRSEYTQSFSVRGNAVSPQNSPSASLPAPSAAVAGAAAVSFNIQVDIF